MENLKKEEFIAKFKETMELRKNIKFDLSYAYVLICEKIDEMSFDKIQKNNINFPDNISFTQDIVNVLRKYLGIEENIDVPIVEKWVDWKDDNDEEEED